MQSVDVVVWARGTRGHLVRGQKHVLLTLATYANKKTGSAFVKEETLVTDCEMPGRTIQRHLKGLRVQGFITVGQRANQHQETEYILTLDRDELPPFDAGAPATGGGSSDTNPSTRHFEQPPLMAGADKPEWVKTLEQDSRWPTGDQTRFITDIEKSFRDTVDLEAEAIKCYEWLQDPSTQGPERKRLTRVWAIWVAKAKKDIPQRTEAPWPSTGRKRARSAKEWGVEQ